MTKKKIIYSFIFFLLLFGLTCYTVFTNINLNDLVNALKGINYGWIILSITLMVIYFLCQGLYMQIILKSMGEKISLIKGTYYAMLEFFYSGITPSSTGGQPAQAYYMLKDDIPMNKSIISLILNTICFKFYLFLMVIIVLIFESDVVFTSKGFNIMFIWGLIADGLVVGFGYLCMYQPDLIRFFIKVFDKIKSFFKPVKKKKKRKSKRKHKDIEKTLENYRKQTEYIGKHKKDVFLGFVVTCIQRTCMFSIAYVVYRALGLHGLSYFELMALQICTQVAIDGLPLPGGTGASEGILGKKMIAMFGVSFASAGMLLTRLFSYYLFLVICMITIIIVTNTHYKDK